MGEPPLWVFQSQMLKQLDQLTAQVDDITEQRKRMQQSLAQTAGTLATMRFGSGRRRCPLDEGHDAWVT